MTAPVTFCCNACSTLKPSSCFYPSFLARNFYRCFQCVKAGKTSLKVRGKRFSKKKVPYKVKPENMPSKKKIRVD
jgi:hypothetical protein